MRNILFSDECASAVDVDNPGLTKREYLIGQALCGLMANPNMVYSMKNSTKVGMNAEILSVTVAVVDALINECNKQVGGL